MRQEHYRPPLRDAKSLFAGALGGIFGATGSWPRTWGRVLTVFFLIALAILWVAVLVPAMVRARASTPLSSARRFRARMDLIAPPGPRAGRWVVVVNGKEGHRSAIVKARRQARAVRRRRRLLTLLFLGSLGTLGAALLRQGGWWEIHVVVDAALVLYVGWLLESRKRRTELGGKVKRLHRRPERRDEYEPAAVGQR